MEPEVREFLTRRGGLGEFVLVVRETQIQAATVDVEVSAHVFGRHRGALEVPSGSALAPRRIPPGGFRFVRFMALPQREVAGVALTARVGVRGVLHVLHALARQFTVARPRTHVEVHVSGIILGRVGVAVVNELLDERVHFWDVTGGARLVGGGGDAQCGIRVTEDALEPVGERPPFLARVVARVVGFERRRGVHQNLVIDVRDVADRGHLVPAEGEPARELVEHERGTHMPDVRRTLHRGTAVVQPGLTRVHRLEVFNGC